MEIVDLESLAPQNPLLQKIDAAADWEQLYAMREPLYSEDSGGSKSINVAVRWLLGYTL
jgi:hypothetical protein